MKATKQNAQLRLNEAADTGHFPWPVMYDQMGQIGHMVGIEPRWMTDAARSTRMETPDGTHRLITHPSRTYRSDSLPLQRCFPP
jgi:hypothetical protein